MGRFMGYLVSSSSPLLPLLLLLGSPVISAALAAARGTHGPEPEEHPFREEPGAGAALSHVPALRTALQEEGPSLALLERIRVRRHHRRLGTRDGVTDIFK